MIVRWNDETKRRLHRKNDVIIKYNPFTHYFELISCNFEIVREVKAGENYNIVIKMRKSPSKIAMREIEWEKNTFQKLYAFKKLI